MRTIEDFFFEVDKRKPNFFEDMKLKGGCSKDLESIEEMSEIERNRYDELISRHKSLNFTSSDDVKKIIMRDLLYKRMQFFNAELLELLDKGEAVGENQIYVYAQFFRPGRQTIAICVIDEEKDLQYFTHKLVVTKREEEVPNFIKHIRTTAIIRLFDKSFSIFSEWKVDGPDTPLNCIEHDLELWHGDKFIKEEEDLAKTADVMRKYAKEIKNIFV